MGSSYPPPPWRLAGRWLVVLYPVPSSTLGRPPLPFRPLTLFGWTGAALFVGRYGPGSSLEYGEFVLLGLARLGRRWGPFVHAISVDSPASLLGGRAVWNLPKTLASFAWTGPAEVVVSGREPLRLRLEPYGPALSLTARGRLLNGRERPPASITAGFRGRVRLARTYLAAGGVPRPRGLAFGVLLEGTAIIEPPRQLEG